MTKEQFLREYLDKQDRAKAAKQAVFAPPPPKGVTPEVVCPLCQGLGQSRYDPPGEHEGRRKAANGFAYTVTLQFVTTQTVGPCVLCEGRKVTLDRSGEKPKASFR